MSTNWQEKWPFIAGFGSLFLFLAGLAANLVELLSVKYGTWIVASLLASSVVYKLGEWIYIRWMDYRALQSKLEEIRDFIMRSTGNNSSNILLCAQTIWLFHRPEQFGNVRKIQSDELVVLDVSKTSLEPGNLLGMHFRIMSSGGGTARGFVQSCDPNQACVKLCKQTDNLNEGDLAIPIIPPEATELEQLLGEILFLISE